MAVQLADAATLTAGRTRRFGKVPPLVVMIAFAILVAVVVVAVTGSLFAPHDPAHQDPLLSSQAPGNGHTLGTDQLGRDVASLLVAGARAALVGPLVVAILTTLAGLVF